MSTKPELHAEVRTDVGKGASRRLRRQGEKVPGIIYGGAGEPVNLTFEVKELNKALTNESFFSQILDVYIDGKSEQTILRDLQRNPANDRVMHIDLLRIRADHALQVSVPLHFINEDRCKGVRLSGGTIAHLMNEVEISCLPKDLPEYIEVFMAELDLNEIIHLSDLALPEGVSIIALEHEDDRPVVTITQARISSEEEDEEAGEEETDETSAEAEGEAEETPDDD